MAFVPATAPELRARSATAKAMLTACELCELRCRVNRLWGERGVCGLTDETWCFKRHVSYAEELELLPSYMVYFGGCNFRCQFCVQAPTCFSPRIGAQVAAGEAARDFHGLVARGARTINLLGGEPSLHLHTILEIAAAAADRGPLPLVLNSNMYMTPEVIELLDGVAVLYVADFKFGNDECARRLANIPRYVEVVTRNLIDASNRARLIVRHLVMPGHLNCCLRPVAAWLARFLPETSFTLMTGYVPAWKATAGTDAMGRTLSADERQEAEALIAAYGLRSEAGTPWEAFQ